MYELSAAWRGKKPRDQLDLTACCSTRASTICSHVGAQGCATFDDAANTSFANVAPPSHSQQKHVVSRTISLCHIAMACTNDSAAEWKGRKIARNDSLRGEGVGVWLRCRL